MAGFLLGYLAEREKELRAEIAFTNNLLSLTRVGNRLSEVVTEVSAELAKVFGGTSVYALVRQSSTGRLFRWDVVRLGPQPECEVREIGASNRELALLRIVSTHVLCARHDRRTKSRSMQSTTKVAESSFPTRKRSTLPTSEDSLRHLAADWISAANGMAAWCWSTAKLGWNRERELRFAQNALRQVAPCSVFDLSVPSAALARRRHGTCRVARELHDTAIQSLISIEMQVDVLRRRSNGHPADRQSWSASSNYCAKKC